MKRVCVFCGSSLGNHSAFVQATRALGHAFVRRNLGLVYGGGNIGLMGTLAETVHRTGGEVIGVIPEALKEVELASRDMGDLRVVKTMHERKALMADLADAFVALPGGFGTLEEFCEMVTWGQLHIHRKPCGLLNVTGFYDLLLNFFDQQVQQGFVTIPNRKLVIAHDNPEMLLDLIIKQPSTIASKIVEMSVGEASAP